MSIIGNPITLGGGRQEDQSLNGILANSNIYVYGGRYAKSGGGATDVFFPKNPNSFDKLDINWANPFEIFVTFAYLNSSTKRNTLYGCFTSNKYYYTPTCELQSENTIWAGFSTGGSSWNNGIALTDLSFQQGVWSYVQYVWDGSVLTLRAFDGANLVEDSSSQTTAHYHNSSHLMAFCNIAQRANSSSSQSVAIDVAFDLNNTYIKSNGTMVWGHKE